MENVLPFSTLYSRPYIYIYILFDKNASVTSFSIKKITAIYSIQKTRRNFKSY